ncbi:MAG: cytochrome c [Bacteroidota bacterium]|nr:cytochrome c [Bacteroidota bacterium]
MYNTVFYTHLITVNLFLLIYLIKTVLLVANKEESLVKFTRVTKVPEMIISVLFLISGVYMLTQIPEIKSMMIIKIIAVLASIPLAVVGFKKRKKALAVISLLLIVAAYGLAEMSKKHPETVKDAVNEVKAAVDGKEIYNANCAKCHGEDGKLGLMGSKDLTESTMDVNARIDIIKNGKGAMSGFNGILSEEQVNAVSVFLESLKK